MNNRIQGEEDVGFENGLTPYDFSRKKIMEDMIKRQRDNDLAAENMQKMAEQNRSIMQRQLADQMQGMPPKPFPSPFAPTASPSPSASPMPSTQENISPEDMEMLNKILMGQDQTQMPSPAPSPMASPFRNIRGTIDRSK
jgi:hypothetical protein